MSELPEGWKLSPISELADVQAGIGFPKKFQGVTSAKYPVYKVGDLSRAYLNDKALVDKAANYVSEEVAAELKGKIFKRGAILFAKIGEALRLNRRVKVVREGLADNNVMAVVPKDCVDDNYLFRFLQYYDVASLSRSTTVPSIRKGDVENVSVPHPELYEQKRIADKLDSVLAKVEAAQARLDKIPAILKRFRQSVLAAATSGELTKEWRENAGIDFLYQEFKVSEVASDEKYSLAIGPFGSNLKVKDYRDDGHPLVFVREIRSKKFGGLKTKYVDSNKFSELAAHKVKPGDVLITKMGDPPGDVAIYPIRRPEAIITSDCIKITPNENVVSSKYLTIVFESFDFKKKIKSITAGVAQQKVSLKKFKELIIALPTRCEQEEISKRFLELEEMAACAEKQYLTAKSRLDKLTQSVLAKAFKGELFNDFVDLENSITDQINKLEAV